MGRREDTIHWEGSIPSTSALAWMVTLLLMDRGGRFEWVEWAVLSHAPQVTVEDVGDVELHRPAAHSIEQMF